MTSRLIITAFALLIALPASADAGKAAAEPSEPALRLMSDDEITLFLKRLDSGVLLWKEQLNQIDIRSLSLNHQDGTELKRSYELCLLSLDNAHREIRSLSEKQTLKLDFLLLVDLDDLARNLDELNRNLIDVNGGRGSVSHKSLVYARGVLGTDAELAHYLVEFQRHILAFAGMIDTAFNQTGKDPPQTQDEVGTVEGSAGTKPIKEQLR
jgi:hypothetical protein